jgi:hypothetical protein
MRTKNGVLLSAGALAAVMLAAGCVAPPPPQNPGNTTTTQAPPPPPGNSSCPAVSASAPGPDSTNPITSWGVDGTAYATAVISNVVYVGGSFNNAVSAGGTTVPRANLAAFCLADGQLLNTFTANFGGGAVNALATDGASLFVGGAFTTLNGGASNKLVKLNAGSGARVGTFNAPQIPYFLGTTGEVLTLAFQSGVIYAGGDFGKIGNSVPNTPPAVDVGNAAGFDSTTGAYTGWHAGADKKVDSIAVSPSWVYIGGAFNTVGVAAHDRLAKLAVGSGAVQSVSYGTLSPGVISARPLDIAVDPNNQDQIFVAIGPKQGPPTPPPAGAGSRFVFFNAAGGQIWHDEGPDGDGQAVEPIGGTVYEGFLGGYNGNGGLRVLGANAANGSVTWSPAAVAAQGVFDLTQGSNRLVAVGDFTTLGTTSGLHGLAIFV